MLIEDTSVGRDIGEESEEMRRVKLINFLCRVREGEEDGEVVDERGDGEVKGDGNNIGSNDTNCGIVPFSNVRQRRWIKSPVRCVGT